MNTYLNKLFNLEGKVVAVTGAGGHLCSEMARGFARAGCSVAVLDLRLEKAIAVKNELNAEGFKNVIALAVDVTKKEDFVVALDAILSGFGHVDILVNGAGINGPTPFFDLTLDEWHAILDSQLTGTFLGCQVFGRYMVDRGKGSIINISSASAGPPLSKAFTYSVAKAGILNLTQNLGREWGTKGVRVNALRPGFLPTEWNRKNFITPEREAAILGHTPMSRFGEPYELLGATLWLASDAASFVTGAEIAVDGGFSCMTI
ncbi:SDR family oxidoreductase [Chlorobium phaeovibrioides]|uniref:SDR family oxidoreductase n=1 Tax=Chlorobium phaeovibrioides TaxID=1094 RepID=UPI000F818451|nr:SDR family oxidoreductase [Chlorobium phaeovibrioides]RTY34222.1 SDR family oxidoreductase [Chlorobium phaeovibrioides]